MDELDWESLQASANEQWWLEQWCEREDAASEDEAAVVS